MKTRKVRYEKIGVSSRETGETKLKLKTANPRWDDSKKRKKKRRSGPHFSLNG
jgi:hypothetical protein